MTQQPESTSPQQNPNTQQDPLSIHRRAIAIDMHADTTQRLLDEQVDLSLEGTHAAIFELRKNLSHESLLDA